MTKAEHPVIGIVNDEATIRESLRFPLEVAGHVVETFTSAADLLEAETQELACVILHNHSPNTTGLELAERLRADDLAIPIILITDSPSPTIFIRAAELGINRVLEKPVDYDDLHNSVNVTRSRGSSSYPVSFDNSARLSRGLPIFLLTGTVSAGASVESETDFSEWHPDRRNIKMFLCTQFPEAQPNRSNETELLLAKKSAPSKAAPQPTIALREVAAEVVESHGLPRKQTDADAAAVSSSTITPVIDAEGSLPTKGRSGLSEKAQAARNVVTRTAAIHKLIAEKAYDLWENQGRTHGYDLTHWLEAEQEIKGCLEDGSVPHGGEPAND